MGERVKLRPLAMIALGSLSIPISQTVVERAFSVMSNREADNRLLAGDLYFRTMMMLAVNRSYTEVVCLERMNKVNWRAL